MNKSVRTLLEAILVTGITVGVAMVMQRPDLRQTLTMRALHMSRQFCQAQADLWQRLATGSAQAYQRARL